MASIYIHYPFCKSKCPYCDFNSYCNLNIDENILIKAYSNELDYYKKFLDNDSKKIDTIYFGGGTPSLMSENFLEKIMDKIFSTYKVKKNCEISIEANPNSISYEKLKIFNDIGINRLSIGIQSLNDENLKFLGRIHNKNEAIKSIEYAQKIFNDRYSIDLMYNLTNQDLVSWENELNEVVKLSPFHISLYQLIIEKNTPFYKNKIKVPDDEIAVNLYKKTNEILQKNGINFYEISNYAKKGYECKHNMVYWSNGEWLGIGAGAHARLNTKINNKDTIFNKKRYAIDNTKNPIKWLEKCIEKGNGINKKTLLTEDEIIEEFLIMSSRVKKGLNIKDLQKNLKYNSLHEIFNLNNMETLKKAKLINFNQEKIKLTNKGFLLLNSIIEKILPNIS